MTGHSQRFFGLLLVAPALALVTALFLVPLGYSVGSAFTQPDGSVGLANFTKAFELYSGDILYTIFIVVTSTALTGLVAIAIAGYLTMGETPWLLTGLAWLYRWPLFIPFIVAAQCMRTFLAKNGLANNTLVASGLIDAADTVSLLDWRGVIITFVWKQAPFVALLLAAAALPDRDRAAAGDADPDGRAGSLVRDHARRAERAADGRRLAADHAHRRHGVPYQLLWRLSGGQCARRHLLPDDRAGRLVLPAPVAARAG
jgi:ABC-type polysaccharide transport system permease subunit